MDAASSSDLPSRAMDNSSRPSTSSSVGLQSGLASEANIKSGSPIWNHFVRISSTEAKCMTCSKQLKTPSKSTTALIRHLENKHKQIYISFEKQKKELEKAKEAKQIQPPAPKQQKIDNLFKTTERWSSDHPCAKSVTKSIGSWMAKSLHPYSLVEEEGFKEVLFKLQPKYNVPTRTTFSRSILPELYLKTKSDIKRDIKSSLNSDLLSISLTTDLWTSAANNSFLAVTCHYVDDTFTLKSFCLENAYFPEEHNNENIVRKLKGIANDWEIDRDETIPIYCLSDNGPNIVCALTQMEWVHLRCFAHTLQLALDNAKRDVKGMALMLSKARAIVGHYKHSSSAQVRLNKIQQQLNIPNAPLSLIQDCETRWNSEFNMLNRLQLLKAAVSADLANTAKVDNLNSQEWELVEGYVKLLKPLDDATTLASSSTLPTLSIVIPVLDGLRANIKDFIQSNLRGVMFARALDKALTTRFPSDSYMMNKHYLLATLIDPRYKAVILTPHQQQVATELLIKEASEIDKCIKSNPSAEPNSLPDPGAEEELSLWKHFKEMSQKNEVTYTLEENIQKQIEAYLKQKTIGMKENPFPWWKDNSSIYNYIAPVARRYLGIPATEVASERVFSSAGNVVTERRRSLTQEHVEELVFLHHNLK